jgi:hypothetical protein
MVYREESDSALARKITATKVQLKVGIVEEGYFRMLLHIVNTNQSLSSTVSNLNLEPFK